MKKDKNTTPIVATQKERFETIISDGHIYWVENGKDHITFLNTKKGKELKKLWKKLHKPIRRRRKCKKERRTQLK